MKEYAQTLVILSLIIIAVVCGIYFGLFSCGGYIWYKQIFTVFFICFVIFVLFIPSARAYKLWKRIFFAVSVFIVFLLSQSVASAFYPNAPGSWAEFFQSFIQRMVHGPC